MARCGGKHGTVPADQDRETWTKWIPIMPTAEAALPLSVTDYLEGEQQSDIRHEYIAGQVFAMACPNSALPGQLL